MELKDNMAKLKKHGGLIFTMTILILIIVFGKACFMKKERLDLAKKATRIKDAPPINVVTMPMEPKTIQDRINLPGSLQPNITLVVAAEVAGSVLEKTVSDGAHVEKGDLLCVIDSAKYQNAYNAAKASYETAQSSKNRLEKLYRSELTSKSELDNITAQMENSQSNMKIAAIDLERCRVKAPVSGIVNQLYVEKGQFMDIGKPVVEILQLNPIKVVVGIPESDVNAIKDITHFNVTVDALGGAVFTAKKNYLTRTTTSLARVYDLELSIANDHGELFPGMFVRVEIVKKTIENALTVPLYSVISVDNKKIVYVAGENPKHDIIQAAINELGLDYQLPFDTAYARKVTTGVQDGWMIEITKGLNVGDQVITVGQRSLANGQKIHIIRTQAEQEEMLR